MREADHECERFIKCPYCDYEHYDMCDYGFKYYHDGEEKPHTCDSCGNIFDVILHVSQKFSSYQRTERKS